MHTIQKEQSVFLTVAGLHANIPCSREEMAAFWRSDALDRFSIFQEKLFAGEVVNESESRAAWHTAFRDALPVSFVSDNLSKIKNFSNEIRKNSKITDVVNIGIGGSDLGPKLICEALSPEIDGPKVHFVSNVDCVQIRDLLKHLSPNNTLFIVTSKSFRTVETIHNLQAVQAWLCAHQVTPTNHIVAVTQNVALAENKYHIPQACIFEMPEWVGGRFSVWSAVGLVCAIAFGFECFYELHQGANNLDEHFKSTSVYSNLPIVYATKLYGQLKSKKTSALGILPYAHRLRTLPAFLQQLFMESLGKQVDAKGCPVDYATGPIVFGGVGTNAQHSFQQLMMQGTHSVAADFILPLSQVGMNAQSQSMLIANCLSQVSTLRKGAPNECESRHIMGGKLANLFLLEQLNFRSLGALLAFYEHAVVTLAWMLKINPFDQWGVEHAKKQSNDYFTKFGEQLLDPDCISKILI